jgi:DNA-binding winged helix-turn-helix (wHTH) protein
VGAGLLSFGPHRVAGPHGPLSSHGVEVKLPPRAQALLWALASQPGQVLTKAALLDAVWGGAVVGEEALGFQSGCCGRRSATTRASRATSRRCTGSAKAALLDAVWGDTVVGEDALAFQIQALRQALADDARQPSYIETVHRVGYRFVSPVTATPHALNLPAWVPPAGTPSPSDVLSPVPVLVGREAELARLRELLARALDGTRGVVFVTGEAGIGKTALVETFLADISGAPALAVARGQCVEHYGAGEAFLPLLEALSRLCRAPGGARVVESLRRHAPSWLARMPALRLTSTPCSALSRTSRGSGCCASSPRAWRPSRSSSRWCCSSKTCTGSIPRPWTCSPWLRGDARRRGWSCWAPTALSISS